jgi:transketolase
MAMAEAHLAAIYNRPNFDIIDHFTYAICSDGDLMEGASHEAASLAGHFGLGKLIYLYDDNHITIEGSTSLAFSENIEERFNSYGWHVQNLGDRANDVEAITTAFENARSNTEQPSLIILRTHIGYGSPNKVDTASAHGSPLGPDEILRTKEAYGWPSKDPFYVPAEILEDMRQIAERGAKEEANWNALFEQYRINHPELAKALEQALNQQLPDDWDATLPSFKPEDGPIATRAVNSKVLDAISGKLPWLMGGSADLEPSTKTFMKGLPYFSKENPSGRNLTWGIRELAMCGTATGMQLHGGVRPYTATFFVFTDYARPAIRLAALMDLPIIYVMTHDSIGLGEDGPTHQPIEHLASLRAMPNLTVIRPADANETVEAWKMAITRNHNPTLLVLSRQGLPVLDRSEYAPAAGLQRGGYILSKEQGDVPQVIIMATGSEVAIALEAKKRLTGQHIDARVVSFPSWELFEEQEASYRNVVIPSDITARISIEAGSTMGWHKYVGERGKIIGIDSFGISAPYQEIYAHFKLTADEIVKKAKELL